MLCTGPLTSNCFETFLGELFGGACSSLMQLHQIAADSVDLERAFIADR